MDKRQTLISRIYTNRQEARSEKACVRSLFAGNANPGIFGKWLGI